MAGHGPLPKEHRQRERDTRRRERDSSTVYDDGEVRGPALDVPVGTAAAAWYERWRRAPQAALFLDTDWSRLQLLAPLVDAYFQRPTAGALGEIRLNEERLGATYADRLRTRIRVAHDDPAPVTPLHLAGRAEALALLAQRPALDEDEAPF